MGTRHGINSTRIQYHYALGHRSTKASIQTAKYSRSQAPESGVAIDVDGLCFSYSNGRQVWVNQSAIPNNQTQVSHQLFNVNCAIDS